MTFDDGVTLTVLEIGHHALKNIIVSDYLKNYLRARNYAEVLVYKGLKSHLITTVFADNRKAIFKAFENSFSDFKMQSSNEYQQVHGGNKFDIYVEVVENRILIKVGPANHQVIENNVTADSTSVKSEYSN